MVTVAVHDLLRIDADALQLDTAAPAWLAAALARSPWVVVRRARPRDARIAVGARGPRRDQRCAAWLDADAVREIRRPEQLRVGAAVASHPALQALQQVEQAWARWPALRWGPAGSVGFELASGTPTVNADSDLDLVLCCPSPPSRAQARALLRALPSALPCRVDALLELPDGAVALRAWADGDATLLLRSANGPRLWQPEAAA